MNNFYALLALLFIVRISALGQEDIKQNIVLSDRALSVREVIKETTNQSGFVFSYSNEIPLDSKVRFHSAGVTVGEILEIVQKQTGIRIQRHGNKILLLPPIKKRTISGYLRDGETGENLIDGNIYFSRGQSGATTNNYGYFSLTVPADTVHISASYAGYEPQNFIFFLKKDTVLNISLAPVKLAEVTVIDSARSRLQEEVQMSNVALSTRQIKAIPALAGEVDVLKGLSLLPGIQVGTEGSAGLYVRGGSPDQNLILLDGVPVYNAYHLFGFFSVFNVDAINHVELIKGGFPARYGGRLSSVVDIRLKEGNREKLKGEASIGLISSKFTLEGPLIKKKASFLISARRTYTDVLLPLVYWVKPQNEKVNYFFYDLNAKFNYQFNDRNRVFLSAYLGRDKGHSTSEDSYSNNQIESVTHNVSDVSWGNITSALRWNHTLSSKWFSNVIATFSRYNFELNTETQTVSTGGTNPRNDFYKSEYFSSIEDLGLKVDFDYVPSYRHSLKLGSYGIHHTFRPGVTEYISESTASQLASAPISADEFGGYAEDDLVLNDKLRLNAGFHLSGFHVENKTFFSPQPRISVRYRVSEKLAVKGSYASMAQYMHLLTNAGVGLPTDLWLPATPKVGPQQSRQFAAGLAYSPIPSLDITAEGFRKTMTGVIEYKDGASYLNTREDWQDKVEIGKGESYGGELLIKKNYGKWTGWLAYTLSWNFRQFDNLNEGKSFPYRYDRRHDIKVVVSHEFKKNIDLSATWVYGTGNAITLPVAEYQSVTSGSSLYYQGRNGYRMQPYHRLDLSATFRKQKKWGERAWIISIYNVYNRVNPYYVDFGTNNFGERKFYRYGFFPIIPSITYSIKF